MDYDIIIVGAGPAGATTAKKLAEKKIKTLLIDKRLFPADKPCGGGLPTRVLKKFPYIKPYIDATSYASNTFSMGKTHVFEISREKPLLYTVLRKDFDNHLVKLAEKTGAKIQTTTTVTDIQHHTDHVALELDNKETLTTNLVIGADGARSFIADKTGLRNNHNEICRCLVTEEPLPPKEIEKIYSKKRNISLYIKTQGIAGYGWVFPKKAHVNVGIGEFESALPLGNGRTNLNTSFSNYIEELIKDKALPSDFTPTNIKGGTLPIFPLKKTYLDRVMVCGDAAGFINPITGEGIYFAMISGEHAAYIASKAVKEKNFSEKFLAEYQKLWMDDFGKDLRLLGRFNKLWGRSSERIVRLLTQDKLFAKLIVGVTGGSISAHEYRNKVLLRYLYVLMKDKLL